MPVFVTGEAVAEEEEAGREEEEGAEEEGEEEVEGGVKVDQRIKCHNLQPILYEKYRHTFSIIFTIGSEILYLV